MTKREGFLNKTKAEATSDTGQNEARQRNSTSSKYRSATHDMYLGNQTFQSFDENDISNTGGEQMHTEYN